MLVFSVRLTEDWRASESQGFDPPHSEEYMHVCHDGRRH